MANNDANPESEASLFGPEQAETEPTPAESPYNPEYAGRRFDAFGEPIETPSNNPKNPDELPEDRENDEEDEKDKEERARKGAAMASKSVQTQATNIDTNQSADQTTHSEVAPNQDSANGLAAEVNATAAVIAESAPKDEEDGAEYADKLDKALAEIGSNFDGVVNSMQGLGLDGAAYLVVNKKSALIGEIKTEIENSQGDEGELAKVYEQRFAKTDNSMIPAIEANLKINSSLDHFGMLLARVTAVPELLTAAKAYVEARNSLKGEIEKKVEAVKAESPVSGETAQEVEFAAENNDQASSADYALEQAKQAVLSSFGNADEQRAKAA